MFGCITLAQGFIKNYSGLLAARFLLGLTESSVTPGCLYIIAMYVFRFVHRKCNGLELSN